ncbi:MAG: LuxR C-terminal-related transcriptional regulator [Actinomycetota bacterium]
MPAKGKGTSRARTRNIRVVIADDHRTFAEALRAALARERGIRVTAVVDSAAGAVEIVRAHSPDIVLITVAGMDAVEAIREIRQASPGTRVVVLTGGRDDATVARAVEAGAAGYLPTTRPVKHVVSSIRAAHRGKPLMDAEETRRVLARTGRRRADTSQLDGLRRLTPREIEILQGMADGLTSARIAEELAISPHTLRTHIQNMLVKLRVHSKMEAMALAIRYGKVRSRIPE